MLNSLSVVDDQDIVYKGKEGTGELNPKDPNGVVKVSIWDILLKGASAPEQGPQVNIGLSEDCEIIGGNKGFRIIGPLEGNEEALETFMDLRDDHRWSGLPYKPECNDLLVVVSGSPPIRMLRADINSAQEVEAPKKAINAFKDGKKVKYYKVVGVKTFKVSGTFRPE